MKCQNFQLDALFHWSTNNERLPFPFSISIMPTSIQIFPSLFLQIRLSLDTCVPTTWKNMPLKNHVYYFQNILKETFYNIYEPLTISTMWSSQSMSSSQSHHYLHLKLILFPISLNYNKFKTKWVSRPTK